MAEALTASLAEQVERRIAELCAEDPRGVPLLRTSVMTHIAWLPRGWVDAGRRTLAGMSDRHPSRTILLIPEPRARRDAVEVDVYVERYTVEGLEQAIASEVVELRLKGDRARAPASVVQPLLIFDLPVFLRWRGQPPFGEEELEQLATVADRLIVDSTEWRDVPSSYAPLAELFPRIVVSDIAWARTSRWRAILASLWPSIGEVRGIRVRATRAQAELLRGWLSSRLGRWIELEHEPAERLEGVAVDGEPAPFPAGPAPDPSDLLSAELDTFARNRVYEAAVTAAGSGTV